MSCRQGAVQLACDSSHEVLHTRESSLCERIIILIEVKTAIRKLLVGTNVLRERENNSGYTFSWGFTAKKLSEGQSAAGEEH